MSLRRKLYQSPTGDLWSLARDPADGSPMIVHQANGPSGAALSFLSVRDFLASGANHPEHQALLRLIATLVDQTTERESRDEVLEGKSFQINADTVKEGEKIDGQDS